MAALAKANSADVLYDFSIMRVYTDGRVERLAGKDVVPAGLDAETGVQSKDVVISPELNISARLYLPKTAGTDGRKLPLLVYFHGGGFVIESAFSPTYQKHLNLVAAEANAVIVSVNYRLAPEHPLPAAYDDSWLALKWLASHSHGGGQEPWLNDYADFDRAFFGGDSAGGNIAHNMAMRVGSGNPDAEGINLEGIYLNCPFFWGKDPIGNEGDNVYVISLLENLWKFVNPGTTGLDDPLINPAADPDLARVGCKRVLVYVGEKDPLRNRGWHYKEALRKKGWDGYVEVVEAKGEDHVFNLINPTSDNAMAMVKKLASFINNV
nr:probable carboxylesterase 12 [Ipomoea batatas]